MFKVNNKATRTTSGVFIVNFDHISHLFLVFLWLTLNKYVLAELLILNSFAYLILVFQLLILIGYVPCRNG